MSDPAAKPKRYSNGDVVRRVGHLEQEVAGIKSDVSGLVTLVQAVNAKLDEKSKPPYALLVSIVGVSISFVTVIGGLALWPLSQALGETKTAIAALDDAMVEHIRDGHPGRVELQTKHNSDRISEIERRSDSERRMLDTNLQREMRDLDRAQTAATEAKDAALDKLLQTEIARVDDKVGAESERINERIGELTQRLDRQVADRDLIVYWQTRAERLADLLQENGHNVPESEPAP